MKGEFIPLSEQDTRLWSIPLIKEAAKHLTIASQQGQIGRFQLEAAIQSVHAQRAVTGQTHWSAIVALYDRLAEVTHSLGAHVGRAAALAESGNAERGLEAMDRLNSDSLANYQPYWVVRARLLERLGRPKEAIAHLDRAISMAHDVSVRNFLLRQMADLA